ncbi:glycoside hydrolase [Geopyxis carbonaria]|nr:glycoside hydrolase [Geopyxis carbonaria]
MVPVSTSVVPESQSDTKKTAKDIANSIIVKYQKQTDLIPGLLGSNYSFAVNGMMWNTFVDYWALTGDESFVSLTKEALLFQQGPDQNFMPPNQTLSIGNDDQATWALAAMSAVENKFPQNADAKWLDLAINTANSVHSRWDTKTCKGGLRWQVFSSNEGYSYKDASSNTKFFQLSARLFAHTGNETYATWANQTHNWLQSSGVISDSWKVYDGIQVENCEIGSKIQWTAPIGSLMSGYAYLYNATGDATWKDSLTSLWNATSSSPFFVNNIMTEAPCVIKGKTSTCNIDQLTFKGILAAGMGAAARLVPSLSDSIDKKLQASAAGAVKADGSQFWAQEVTDPKAPGVSEQLSELSVVISTLSSTVNNSTANATDGDSATASGTADVKKGAASRVGTSGMATMALVAGVMWAVL